MVLNDSDVVQPPACSSVEADEDGAATGWSGSKASSEPESGVMRYGPLPGSALLSAITSAAA
jgi:hypothetical protein